MRFFSSMKIESPERTGQFLTVATTMTKKVSKYVFLALGFTLATFVLIALNAHQSQFITNIVADLPWLQSSPRVYPEVKPELDKTPELDLESEKAPEVDLNEEKAPPTDLSEEKVPASKYIHKITGRETKDYIKETFIKSAAGQTESSTILIVALVANEGAFGGSRTVEDFLTSLLAFEYDPNAISLAFFCGTEKLYETMSPYIEKWLESSAPSYRKVTLIRAPFLDSTFGRSEHAPEKQKARRRLIARARNFILFNSLENEEYTLFLDADIVKMENNDFIHRFIKSEKDIIVPRVTRGFSQDYDKNTWRGQRQSPSEKELELMDTNKWDEFKFIPMDVPGKMYHLQDHVDKLRESDVDSALKDLDYVVEIDSVGGAVLFFKSIIFKQGVIFPASYIVGTTWEREEGFDGIETEGVCYLAKLLGYKCWAMPNLVAVHFS